MSKKQNKKKKAAVPKTDALSNKKRANSISTKKRVVTTPKPEIDTKKKVVQKTTSRLGSRATVTQSEGEELLYGRTNYILMAVGVGLMLLGYLLMTGGAQPNAETWDPNIIYNFRRVTLGPFLVLAGIGIEIFAIFKRK